MNCMLADEMAKMSRFERAAWSWYCENVSTFAMEAGIVADAFRALRLKGIVKRLFSEAMSMIHQAAAEINRKQLVI